MNVTNKTSHNSVTMPDFKYETELREDVDVPVNIKERNPNICGYPFTGLVVNPDGRLLACCHAPTMDGTLGHISKVDSLTDFYNEGPINDMRADMKRGILPPNICTTCIKWREAGITAPVDRKFLALPWDDDNWPDNNPKVVRYLEYTPSNLCNQSCVTCGGVYSSKWWAIDKIAIEKDKLRFRTEDLRNHRTKHYEQPQHLSDEDWQKVLTCIEEGVWKIYIKGGEPFADARNLELLERIGKGEYPELRQVSFSTNMARMTPRIVKIFNDILDNTDIRIGCSISIDGVGKQYEWIRSTPWERLIENCRKFPVQHVTVSTTVSIYNFWNVREIVEALHRFPIRITGYNGRIVNNPYYLNPWTIISQQDEDEMKAIYKDYFILNPLGTTRHAMLSKKYNPKNNDYLWIPRPNKLLKDRKRDKLMSNFREFTQFMNDFRGFNIQDHVPELEMYL